MHTKCIKPAKVAIVGVGNVGSTAAYALMMDGVVSELALVDCNKDKVMGEVLDLQHGMQFTKSTTIIGGDSFELVADAQIVVISAGVAQKPGESRTDLLEKNVAIYSQIIPKITQHNKHCILLIVTNPLDVLTYVSWKLSGFDSCRIFGTGTVLDTARLRYLLGQHFDINPKDITASILGEHGVSEFAWWSKANVAGVSFDEFGVTLEQKNTFLEKVQKAAQKIIHYKGATYYAIALVIAKIVRATLLDQSRVFTVSTVLKDYRKINETCLSVPTVVRKSGICQRFTLEFDDQEEEFFQLSAEKVSKEIKKALALL